MFLANPRRRFAAVLTLAAVLLPATGRAAAGHLEDAIADVLVWVVLVFVPLLAIWAFWKLHVLPEVIAEKRHHPQTDAIKSLCLLSLLFGGMLWPFAWLWAHTKPIGYRLAYGRDKHDDYYEEMNLSEAEAARKNDPGSGAHSSQEARPNPETLG